jgi:hypothetical protein
MTQRKAKTRSAIDAMAEAAEPTIDEQIEAIEDEIDSVISGGEHTENLHVAWTLRCLHAAHETLAIIKKQRHGKPK